MNGKRYTTEAKLRILRLSRSSSTGIGGSRCCGVRRAGGLATGRYSGCVEPRGYGCRRPSARSCGPEFIAQAVQQWLRANQIQTIYLDPGSPWQNGFVESFHGRFRDECWNREQSCTLTEARVVIEDYRREYHQRRPHSRWGDQSPARFAAPLSPSPSAVGLRPPSVGDGQTQNPSSK
jgi:hypothetical protein